MTQGSSALRHNYLLLSRFSEQPKYYCNIYGCGTISSLGNDGNVGQQQIKAEISEINI